jgi:tyrosyl-tRNA synthetase
MDDLLRGIVDVFPQVNLEDFLSQQRRIKLGFDPTSDFLHLGHSILLRKLQAFQREGHKPVVVIGDFTAMIGDPTGKSSTRKQLSKEEVRENTGNFLSIIRKFLNPAQCEFRANSEHFKSMGMEDTIRLQSMMTVQQLLAKQDFSSRLEKQVPISLHEFMYPLLQGFDSFKYESDVELGGVEQKFNVSVGRGVQKHFGSDRLQVGMLMPILVGTDGVQKMSKSLNNAIGINEHPLQMFSKLEKIPDHCVDDYITLLTDCDLDKFPSEPRKRQQRMAFEVVSTFHGKEKAFEAKWAAESIALSSKTTDVDAPEISIQGIDFPTKLPNLLKSVGMAESTSDARRKIRAGCVKLEGVKIVDENFLIRDKESIEGKLFQTSRNNFFRIT